MLRIRISVVNRKCLNKQGRFIRLIESSVHLTLMVLRVGGVQTIGDCVQSSVISTYWSSPMHKSTFAFDE